MAIDNMEQFTDTTTLSLDPSDWSQMRAVAHRALDEVLDYQMNIRDKPAWQPVPDATETLLKEAAPRQGLGPETVVSEMLQHVMPYPPGHAHPRFWGWVCGTGTPIGMIADMLASGVNATAGTFNDAPTRLEDQVIAWMRELFGFPESAGGLVTSGASVANVIGMAVGRDARLGNRIRAKGLGTLEGTPVVYASTEVHSSVAKAMMLLGLGQENLHKVPVNEAYEMRLDLLDAMVAQDRSRGMQPVMVIANGGSVNTGSIDDLGGIADVAARHGLWFHVDGAIGALAMMSEDLRPLFKGIERADSLAFDFHKWLYVNYEAGCVLIRDGAEHRKSFTAAASYLEAPSRGVGAMVDTANIRGPQLSRGFKALKVWAQIREFGMDGLGKIQAQNVAQIRHLAALIDAHPRLERLSPLALNILCFRYIPADLDAAHWDGVNQELLMRLQEQGHAVPSSTRLNGHYVLRVANTNHRTRFEDFDALVAISVRLGREIEASLQRG